MDSCVLFGFITDELWQQQVEKRNVDGDFIDVLNMKSAMRRAHMFELRSQTNCLV